MKGRPYRVYADTSVYGGVFDEEFGQASRLFFEQVRMGRFNLVTSALVQEEIVIAPTEVQGFFEEMVQFAEIPEISEEAIFLRNAYLDGGIVSHQWAADALHVALATVNRCSLIVSWNFKHVVHFQKISLYNAASVLHGYQAIGIFSPQEVIFYENEGF